MIRRMRLALLLLVAIGLTGAAHEKLPHKPRAQQGELFVPRASFAKAMALGFDAVHADYYWIQAVLLAGGSPNPTEEATHLGRLIDVVVTLDPWVGHPYRFAAVWLTKTLDDVRLANELLERSFAYHPDEWRNYFYLGFNRFYYLGEDAAAADALLEASRKPGSPRYLPRLVARLRSESSDLTAAALFLEELVSDAPDDASRAEYQAALDEIEIEWHARSLDRAREQFREIRGRDIAFVEELATGPDALLSALPSAEPSSLPAPLRRGSRWVIDDETGQIVSSYLGRRYVVHTRAALDRENAEKARARWNERAAGKEEQESRDAG